MTMQPLLALRSWAHQPVVQDGALAAGLLAVCLPVNNPAAMLRAVAAAPSGGAWGGAVVWGWWTATAFALVGVALRRRRPLPMLGVCVLATAGHLAIVVPTVVDLAVVVLLATVAAHCPRPVSRAALAGLLLLVVGWCLSDAQRGRPVNGVPSFRFEVVHLTGPPHGHVDTTVAGRAESSNTWSAVALLGSVLLAAWAVGSGTRSRREYLHQLHARAADLERERDQQAALAVAAERGRISREMHDVVAHGLSLIVIQAQGADAALDNRPADTRSALHTIVKTGRDSLADMRRVLAALGEVEDTWHPQPGLAQLPGLLARVRQTGTTVRLRVDGTPSTLPSAVDLSSYRIVQEALTNVMKHAGAGASADVVIRYSDAEVCIEVGDDGHSPNGNDGGGNGLRGMDSRVKLLGGRLSAGPRSDGGFVVRAHLPVEGREA
ncbi:MULTISPECIES: sensor histidine kinase [unclassified Streptomyces]|uniref:sensor histidine kinase n=1 Tax=unclassified Streptomyces TaxID=2593676 RepID=UPI0036EE1143